VLSVKSVIKKKDGIASRENPKAAGAWHHDPIFPSTSKGLRTPTPGFTITCV
jgi:hypothetical protein